MALEVDDLVQRALAGDITGVTSALGLAEDLQRGLIDRFRSLPMARSAVLAGRTLADSVRNVFVVALMMAVDDLFPEREGERTWHDTPPLLVTKHRQEEAYHTAPLGRKLVTINGALSALDDGLAAADRHLGRAAKVFRL